MSPPITDSRSVKSHAHYLSHGLKARRKMKNSTVFACLLVLMACSPALGGKKKKWRLLNEQVHALDIKMDEFIASARSAGVAMRDKIDHFEANCGCQEPPPEEVCPEGWTEFQENCYSFQETPMDWKAAIHSCVMSGGYLAVPSNAEEDDWLSNMALSHGLEAWLGASDIHTEGVWQSHIDKTPLEYIHWADSREPNNGITENCLAYKIREGKAYWNDARCDLALASICEHEPM